MSAQVFFAYTRDGRQFDGVVAPDAETALDLIGAKYEGEASVTLSDGVEYSLDGFEVRPRPVPVELFWEMEKWSDLMAKDGSADVLAEFLAAHERMMDALREAEGMDAPL